MKLSYLMKEVIVPWDRRIVPNSEPGVDPEITSIHAKAQEVKPGGLFFAIKGFTKDGHDYIGKAFENKAAAVVVQKVPDKMHPDIVPAANIIQVQDTRKAMACISSRFFGYPTKKITLTGITGTNGKTTTTWLLESILNAAEYKVGVIGTINVRYNGKIYDTPVTTPESIDLQKIFSDMVDAGITHVIMEVSSHAVDLHRVDYCKFDVGVFTNFTQDHLDYHKTMDAYWKCKKIFFTKILSAENSKGTPTAVLNIDDQKGSKLTELLNKKNINILKVGVHENAELSCKDIKDDISGLKATIFKNNNAININSSLAGSFNLENILSASGAALSLGISLKNIKKGIEDCRNIPGRLERIENDINRFIFVDYAHTPDALESILKTLRLRAKYKLITLFGCGGDRDPLKRKIMGKIAAEYSDLIIVTSDNPRSENPEKIIQDILKGINIKGTKKELIVEVDREKALQTAVKRSNPGDIIIAAGKGHETYQILKNGKIDFDDRIILKEAVKIMAPVPFSVSDIENALLVKSVTKFTSENLIFSSVSTDSRKVKQNELFLALKGEHFDGQDYITELFSNKIKGFIVHKGFFEQLPKTLRDDFNSQKNGALLFEIDNTLTGLGSLAKFQRLRCKAKIIAITGSNGKTTTRKITGEILKQSFNTLTTKGNFNNEIGLPLTLLKLSLDHEWAVVEMGMNHPGEISRLANIALPDVGIITNTSAAHLEGLGTTDNIANAKAEMFQHMNHNSTAIINIDDPRFKIMESKAKKSPEIKNIICFGTGKDADIKADAIAQDRESQGMTKFLIIQKSYEAIEAVINSPAPFMVTNATAAVAAAREAGASKNDIKKGLKAFTPVQGRMSFSKISNKINLIDDSYNANPDSVKQALITLALVSGQNTSIAVLGDMLELGKDAVNLHGKTGKLAAQNNISKLYTYGKLAAYIVKGAVQAGFPEENTMNGTREEIAKKIIQDTCKVKSSSTPSSMLWVLVKGSRGMKMEKVIHKIQKLKCNNKETEKSI